MTMNGKREYFDSIAAQWDGFPGPPCAAENQRAFILRATQHQPRRILDLGCGTGVLVPYVRAACPHAQLTEMDYSAAMLAVNREKHGDCGIEYLCQSIESCDLPIGAFDLILCFNALPHFDVPRALARCAELLAPGGRIAIGHLMSSGELNAFHGSLSGPVAHDHLPTATVVGKMLTAAKLSLLNAEECPGSYFVLAAKAVNGNE